ncbi:hypothetical protein VTN00DRAFT_10141 [Thermoascus crustaceus]|uniref:uncharacterized protein n=1 Tax=Thermoascus crustaceus TaxID=5088 RepID=UPI003742CEBC
MHSGYLISRLSDAFQGPAPEFVQQVINYRGRTLIINGDQYHIPLTSLGNTFIIFNVDPEYIPKERTPVNIALALNRSRHELSDMNYLSCVHALYTHLYQRGIRAGRFSYDAGHADSIINNLVK